MLFFVVVVVAVRFGNADRVEVACSQLVKHGFVVVFFFLLLLIIFIIVVIFNRYSYVGKDLLTSGKYKNNSKLLLLLLLLLIIIYYYYYYCRLIWRTIRIFYFYGTRILPKTKTYG